MQNSNLPQIRIKGNSEAVERLFANQKTMELLMLRTLFGDSKTNQSQQDPHKEETLVCTH